MVGLAGVSRRSFYEQFANKQECFLATYDLIATRGAGRVGAAYRDARGDDEQRMQAAFGELGQAISDNWNSASLAILEAPKAGAPALLRLRRASATFEQMLSGCFEHGSAPSPLPAPVIRGIAGGLHAALSNCLREGTAEAAPAVTEEMFRWTLLFQTPAAKQLAERLSERARAALAQGRKAPAARRANGRRPALDDRERLLEQALRLAVVEDYRELSAPQIADAADVSIDAFFELFDGKQECFLAALDMLGERADGADGRPGTALGRLAQRRAPHDRRDDALSGRAPDLRADDRRRRVRGRPGGDRAQRAPRAGHRRAPDRGRTAAGAHAKLVVQGVAGALSHTVRCQVASGQIQLLSVLADYLSYIVLAPFLGAEQAAALVIEQA